MVQCREGWHLAEEPLFTVDEPTPEQIAAFRAMALSDTVSAIGRTCAGAGAEGAAPGALAKPLGRPMAAVAADMFQSCFRHARTVAGGSDIEWQGTARRRLC